MAQKTPRVTLELIYHELQGLHVKIAEHAAIDAANFQALHQSLDGTEAAPGLKMKVDRLEQTDLSRKSHLTYLWTAISALAVAFLSRVFWPHTP